MKKMLQRVAKKERLRCTMNQIGAVLYTPVQLAEKTCQFGVVFMKLRLDFAKSLKNKDIFIDQKITKLR